MPIFCQAGQKAYFHLDSGLFIFDGPIDVSTIYSTGGHIKIKPGESFNPLGFPNNQPSNYTARGIHNVPPNCDVWVNAGNIDDAGYYGDYNATFGCFRTCNISALIDEPWNTSWVRAISASQNKGSVNWFVSNGGGGNCGIYLTLQFTRFEIAGYKIIVSKNGSVLFSTVPTETLPGYTVRCGDRCPEGQHWDDACGACVCDNMPALVTAAQQIKEFIKRV